MSKENLRKLSVAAVQMACEPGKTGDNLKRAHKMVEEAVEKGAELVLLPELMPSGYMATEAIWDSAESMNGQSVAWLKETAKRYEIYLGFTFLEAEGEDFYNAFVLSTPKGDIAGRVRKSPPASIEANFYKAGDDPHVIETEIGRIGVSICYENLLHERLCELSKLSVDIVLSPSAAGRPKAILPGDVQRFEKMLIQWRGLYGDALGVPNVIANRVGLLDTELPSMLPHLKSSFPGLSVITDSDGTVLAELGEEEGVIIADVHLDPYKKKKGSLECHGKMWVMPVPWYAFIWPMTQKTGEKRYRASKIRPLKARSKAEG